MRARLILIGCADEVGGANVVRGGDTRTAVEEMFWLGILDAWRFAGGVRSGEG